MRTFAIYNVKNKQIITDDRGQLLIFTNGDTARDNKISGEVVVEVEIKMAMKSPSVTRKHRGNNDKA